MYVCVYNITNLDPLRMAFFRNYHPWYTNIGSKSRTALNLEVPKPALHKNVSGRMCPNMFALAAVLRCFVSTSLQFLSGAIGPKQRRVVSVSCQDFTNQTTVKSHPLVDCICDRVVQSCKLQMLEQTKHKHIRQDPIHLLFDGMHDKHSSLKLLKSNPFLASLYNFAAARRRAAGATGATSASGRRQRRQHGNLVQHGNPVQQEEDDDEVMNTSLWTLELWVTMILWIRT